VSVDDYTFTLVYVRSFNSIGNPKVITVNYVETRERRPTFTMCISVYTCIERGSSFIYLFCYYYDNTNNYKKIGKNKYRETL